MQMITRWSLFKKFLTPIIFLTVLTLFGMSGYMLIEGMAWLDALYMTVITVSTVGYGEIMPLSNLGRVFTMLLIICSIGLVAYYITLATRLILDGEWTRNYRLYKQYNQMKKMENHVIICGYGRNGRQACEVLRQNGVTYTVIEQGSPGSGTIDEDHDTLILYGDATRDEILLEAGILHAKALISSLPDDASNLFVVLTARQLNPAITIISRASYESSVNKLKIAGADNVIMPDKLGGGHMATLVLIPDVHEFISLLTTQHNEQFMVTEFHVTKSVVLKDLDLWQKTGSTILGVKQPGGRYLRNPVPDYQVNPEERLIVMGSKEQLQAAVGLV